MEIKIEAMCEEHLNLIDINKFDDFWNANILKTDFESPNSIYIIAKNMDDIVGFAGMNIIANEAHIANIAVRKDMRNLGIGTKMLQDLMYKAEKETSLITLEVNTENLPAINLYKKFGFQILGKRIKYYNNQFDAYIMTNILKQ